MIYPAFLKQGDTIGITAPSGSALGKPIDTVILEQAKQHMQKLGFLVQETENVRMEDKLVSSSAEERAKEFYDLYCDENIKHILAATGGDFLMEMMPYLEKYPLQEKTPKWVQGFSDISLLLFYLTTKYHIATVHASNFGAYGRNEVLPSFDNTFSIIADGEEKVQESFALYESTPINWQEGKELEKPHLDTPVAYRSLYGTSQEKMQGTILGGCIDVLKTIIGTPYDYAKSFARGQEEGILWYLENCEMNVCDLYRALWQMREAGWFENSKGFLIGRTMSKEAVHGYTYEDALHQAFDDLHVPVIYDVDVGHTQLQWTMINGAKGIFTLDGTKGKLITKMQ